MIEVHPNIFVGSAVDYEQRVRGESGWAVVHACKEPYHRQALGYSGRSAPSTHPEYLFARREDRLFLNLVDADEPRYFSKEIMIAAISFIHEALASGKKVLIHCNQGESRGPSIALLFLACRLSVIPSDSLESSEIAFRVLYPEYRPKNGIRGHLLEYWAQYRPTQKD